MKEPHPSHSTGYGVGAFTCDCGHSQNYGGCEVDLMVGRYIRATIEVCHDCWNVIEALPQLRRERLLRQVMLLARAEDLLGEPA